MRRRRRRGADCWGGGCYDQCRNDGLHDIVQLNHFIHLARDHRGLLKMLKSCLPVHDCLEWRSWWSCCKCKSSVAVETLRSACCLDPAVAGCSAVSVVPQGRYNVLSCTVTAIKHYSRLCWPVWQVYCNREADLDEESIPQLEQKMLDEISFPKLGSIKFRANWLMRGVADPPPPPTHTHRSPPAADCPATKVLDRHE